MEFWTNQIALNLSLIIEIVGSFVIAVGLFKFLAGYFSKLFHKGSHHHNALLRVQFGSSLAIALELLLAADILRTAVAPSWEEIGKLAAIAAIRTALNYFLERELKGIENHIKKNVPE